MIIKTVEERLACLETEMKIYHAKFDKFLGNEFPHAMAEKADKDDIKGIKKLLYIILTYLLAGSIGLAFAIVQGFLR